MTDPAPPPDPPAELSERDLLSIYVTREAKIGRIREIEHALEKMEMEDEHNDPRLIQGHINLTRGFRTGCGVFFICLALLSWRVASGWRLDSGGHGWARVLVAFFGAGGIFMIARGLLYRPDPQMIQEAYAPHRGTKTYRDLVAQMDILARALSQDLRAEDAE